MLLAYFVVLVDGQRLDYNRGLTFHMAWMRAEWSTFYPTESEVGEYNFFSCIKRADKGDCLGNPSLLCRLHRSGSAGEEVDIVSRRPSQIEQARIGICRASLLPVVVDDGCRIG